MNILSHLRTFLIATSSVCSLNAHAISSDEMRGGNDDLGVIVVQNRYFLKQYRPELGVFAGRFLNEAYTKTNYYGFRLSLFANEWLGVGFQNYSTDVTDTEDMKALKQLEFREVDSDKIVYPAPESNPIRGGREFTLIAAPFYGKINVMDFMIIYTDIFASAGMIQMETDQGTLNGGVFGAGERFFVGKSLCFQFDFRNRFYTEKRGGRETTRNALGLDLGVSYFFL